MTDEQPDVDALADLDAALAAGDAVDPRRHAEALAYPAGRAVLAALAATRADLGALPAVTAPADARARWDAALAAEAARPAGPSGSVPHPAPPAAHPPRPPGRRDRERPPGRPPRRRTARPALVLGALLVVVLAVAGVLQGRDDRPSVSASGLGELARASVGTSRAGPFDDPVRRAACLRAVAPQGVTPASPLLGGQPVRFEGRAGVLLILATGELGAFRVVVVDPGCGPDGGTLITEARIGR